MEFASTFLSNWFAPSSLFVLLNLMIGTIFLTARLGARRAQPEEPAGQLARARSSSFSLLDRVRSINLQPLHTPDNDPARLTRPPSLLDRLRSLGQENPGPEPKTEPSPKPTKSVSEGGDSGEGRDDREAAPPEIRRPETEPSPKMAKSAGEGGDSGGGRDDREAAPPEIRRPETEPSPKMAKSASEGGDSGGGREDREAAAAEKRRPETARRREECVDVKADDFINRFKQQLRLQRLASLKRLSEMIKGT